jgi:hypothetical protein
MPTSNALYNPLVFSGGEADTPTASSANATDPTDNTDAANARTFFIKAILPLFVFMVFLPFKGYRNTAPRYMLRRSGTGRAIPSQSGSTLSSLIRLTTDPLYSSQLFAVQSPMRELSVARGATGV